MEKTIKEIADSLGIDKQKVYRYIKKNCINEVHQKNGVMYYDEAVQKLIKDELCNNTLHQETLHESASNDAVLDVLLKQYETLKSELEAKNRQLEAKDIQIAELSKLLDQQQQLQLVEQKKALLLENKEESRIGLWGKLFKKNSP